MELLVPFIFYTTIMITELNFITRKEASIYLDEHFIDLNEFIDFKVGDDGFAYNPTSKLFYQYKDWICTLMG